jgi:hypothetical protein
MTSTGTSLDVEAIRRDAEELAGTADWDDSEVSEPLEVLSAALTGDARLNEAGVATAAARFRNLLASYIQIQADARAYPEIAAEQITAPIVMVGLPRCGTTLLHGLLSADPAHRAPVFWEALHPSPPPALVAAETDSRRARVQAVFDEAIKRSPSLLASLPYSADLNAECNIITQPTLRSISFTAAFYIPSYFSWYLGADHSSAYRYHHQVLRELQWGDLPRRWVLKGPPHLFHLGELVAEYPDATLIQNHRDPKRVVSSQCELMRANRVVNSDDVDLHELGAEMLERLGTSCDRAEEFRTQHPEVTINDVYFDELNADPLGYVEALYDRVGLELTDAARAGMAAWLADNARDKRPVAKHKLADFGLTEEQVDERFEVYRANRSL